MVYGYHEQNKFCLERDIDERLYNKCLKSLENPGDQKQKPIVVLGNSGSGKSIAVANLAYRIFSEHRYPVIFQNNLDNFFSDDDSSFTKLDNLLMFLEGSGAPAILLIIDKSVAGDSESDKLLHVFLKLRNHGRNLTMVFTSYNHSISDKNLSKYFVSISMENKLSTKELSSLRTLLKLKAKIKSKETIDELVKLAETKDDFLVFLYYAFQDLRKPLEKGIYEEFRRTIELAIDKKSLQNDIRELLISVAIASQFKKGIPCNLVYRLINPLDEETISAVSRIPSFSYRPTEEDNYEFRIRTTLESDMLLKHLNKNDSGTKIEYIKKCLINYG